MDRHNIVSWLLVLGLLGCDVGQRVNITPTNLEALQPRVAELRVVSFLDGRRAKPGDSGDAFVSLAPAPPRTVRLEGSVRGQLRLEVEAWSRDDPPRLLALGQDTLQLTGDEHYDRVVPMTPQVCSRSGFCWESPLPQGNPLHGIAGSAADDLWAVGEDGTLLHHNGSSWSSQAPAPRMVTGYLRAVWSGGREDVWAVGDSGAVLRYDGVAWRQQIAGAKSQLNAVWGSDAFVWAAGNDGVVLRYDRAGNVTLVPSGTAAHISAVWGSGPGDVWFAGERGVVLRWDGTRLSPRVAPTSVGIDAVWGSGPSDVWFAGESGVVLHQDGVTLTQLASGTGVALRAICGGVGGAVWMVGDGGITLRWQSEVRETLARDSLGHDLLGLWCDPAGGLRAVGVMKDPYSITTRSGSLWCWSGSAWSSSCGAAAPPAAAAELPTPLYWRALWKGPGQELWAVGSAGFDGQQTLLGIARRFDGTRWSEVMRIVGTKNFTTVWGSGPKDVWAAGDPGLYHWDGESWTRASAELGNLQLSGLWGSGASDAWAAGGGVMLRWDGTRWSRVSAPQDALVGSLWGSGPSDVWAVGQTKRLGYFTPVALHWDGAAWIEVPTNTGKPLYTIWGSGSADVWAAGLGGALVHWDGKVFTEQPVVTPAYMLSLWGQSATDIWAVGDPGVAMHRDASGWQIVNTGAHAELRGVVGDGAGGLWAVGAHGTILHRP